MEPLLAKLVEPNWRETEKGQRVNLPFAGAKTQLQFPQTLSHLKEHAIDRCIFLLRWTNAASNQSNLFNPVGSLFWRFIGYEYLEFSEPQSVKWDMNSDVRVCSTCEHRD